jgi:hypothetical protein
MSELIRRVAERVGIRKDPAIGFLKEEPPSSVAGQLDRAASEDALGSIQGMRASEPDRKRPEQSGEKK